MRTRRGGTPGSYRFDNHGKDGRCIKLSDLRDLRIEMGRVYRQVDAGVIPSQEGTRRVYILRQIADIIVAAELERRIDTPEEHYEQREQRALPARLN